MYCYMGGKNKGRRKSKSNKNISRSRKVNNLITLSNRLNSLRVAGEVEAARTLEKRYLTETIKRNRIIMKARKSPDNSELAILTRSMEERLNRLKGDK